MDYPIDDHKNENLSRFVIAFEEALAKCNISIPEETVTEESAKKDDSCWVYLMRDIANNSYKIGISNNPRYRERTLQSEKPTIEKLAAKNILQEQSQERLKLLFIRFTRKSTLEESGSVWIAKR